MGVNYTKAGKRQKHLSHFHYQINMVKKSFSFESDFYLLTISITISFESLSYFCQEFVNDKLFMRHLSKNLYQDWR